MGIFQQEFAKMLSERFLSRQILSPTDCGSEVNQIKVKVKAKEVSHIWHLLQWGQYGTFILCRTAPDLTVSKWITVDYHSVPYDKAITATAVNIPPSCYPVGVLLGSTGCRMMMVEAQSCSLTTGSSAVNAGCQTTLEDHEVDFDLTVQRQPYDHK